MSINLLDMVKSQLTGAVMEKVSGMLGENPANTQTAINAALPTLLGGIVNSASTTQGAQGLMDMLKTGGHDGGIFDNLSGLLGGGDATKGLLSSGGGILSSLLGDKMGGVVNLISSLSGIRSGSASSLLSLAAPLLMGGIGKQVSSQGLGLSGLVSMLMGQSDAIKAALPTGAASLLGLSGLGDFKGAATAAATNVANSAARTASNVGNTAQAAVEEGGSMFSRLLPWLLGALGLLAALWYFKGCGDKSAEAAKVKMEAAAATAKMKADSLAKYTADMATKAKDAAVDAMSKVTLPGGAAIEFKTGSVEDNLVKFITDKAAAIDKNKWFNFEGLNFDTGKATLQKGSEAKLSNIAAILKAYPAVKLKLGGYTDNVGKPESNKTLSDARAKTVVAELVKLGVAAARLEGEGYGQEHPCADNTTEAGRAKNRRIDVSVRAK
jgi:OmpA-OmpF porin, OOP family